MARRSRIPLVIAAILGIALVLVVRSFTTGTSSDASTRARAGCTPLNITASVEKSALLASIAEDYNRANRAVGDGCADVRVAPLASGTAADALTGEWNAATYGPRPDVWSPASNDWAGILEQRLATAGRAALVPQDQPSISKSPLVIAMPRPMAEVLGWPDRAIGWADLARLATDPAGWGGLGHPEWGSFKLGKTNPNVSTSGLGATTALFYAATGRSTDLTAADVDDPRVREFVRGVEGSVVHYGDTTLTFLENLYDAAARGQALTYISAVTVIEKSVWDYNQGNPSGNPATLGKRPPPQVPLVAIYPKDGTLISDGPYLVLTADWVDDAKRAAAADFLTFVRAPQQQQRFQDAAFRSFEGRPGDPISRENGMLPDVAITVLDQPGPTVLNRIVASWAELRKKANLVFVIDVSGSMGEPIAGTGGTRLDLAKTAAVQGLSLLSSEDTLSLWAFSTERTEGDGSPFRVLVPPGTVGAVRDAFTREIGALQPQGGTALYRTTRAAVAQVRSTFDPTRINAVVLLTDGKNEDPKDNDLERLIGELAAVDRGAAVRVFPIAYGEDADLAALTRLAKATTATAYDAGDATSIEKVVINVVSNF